ncbi:MAG: diaminopimelate decarboxylase [Chitinophagaceae bacterium]|nr:diaminopimelate decarboxylase [Chitinophagaceae bacterium]MBK7680613.1 diaminopimelate decarboxylase [Chitinophagaceae bacterium]MBK9660176.1 diaminopimelate decarboxylase [Chitinophagaceae bacterium]MBK9939613.1 diaminopimelate decarboxylase [Chitinophagaceae bacterium]MBP6231899.1 diaminopimelate decarboxylase [Chitinophagaceae bacterium]
MPENLSKEQLLQAANEFGTPLYVYHAEKIKEQYEKLTTAFSVLDTKFFYASKALTNINILRYVKNMGCEVDCSSINEVKLALHAGFEPQQILYTSNGIAFSEIEEAVETGVHINIDSLSNLEKFGKKFGHSYPVGIRIRPNIMAGGNLKISTGHDTSKFGIPVDQLDTIKDVVKATDLFIRTLHIHTGSDIKDVEVFVNGMEVLFELIPHFPELEVIDLGGGFKVPYIPGEKETNVQLLAQKIKETFDNHPVADNKKFQLWFEPGKFLVSECGYLLAQVTVVKDTGPIVFVAIDSGLNHLIRPMMYDAYHHIENISNPTGEQKVYTITGNICETDTFAADRSLNEIREGDYLAIHNAGAYGFEMASNYNSRFKPAEVMISDNQAYLIRKRDDINDLLKNQITDL